VPLARYWLHAAHLIVNGEKMSKSKGNFLTLRDLLGKGYQPRELRYLLLSVHYRRVLDLTDESLAAARQNLNRLDELCARLAAADLPAAGSGQAAAAVAAAGRRFHESLDDDLNTSGALGALFEMVREANGALDAGRLGRDGAGACSEVLASFQKVFGIGLGRAEEVLPEPLQELIRRREEARAARQWAEADRLRDALATEGVVVEDMPQGTRWKRQPRE